MAQFAVIRYTPPYSMNEHTLKVNERHRPVPTRYLTILQRFLGTEETVLWADTPDAHGAARRRAPHFLAGAAIFLVLSMGPLSVLAGRHLAGSLTARDAAYAGGIWWPLLMLLGSLLMMLCPVLAYVTARRTVYAVTDRRILSLRTDLASTTLRSAALNSFERPALILQPDGTGDILLMP